MTRATSRQISILQISILGLCLYATLLCSLSLREVSAATPEQLRYFEEKVRPLLVAKCHSCHGESKQKGGLRLDSSGAMATGGDSGPPVISGKPDESLLIEAVRYESLEMPPDGKLADEEIQVLVTWVAMGSPWPNTDPSGAKVRSGSDGISDQDRAYWAFQPIRPVSAPTIENDAWSRNEIDRFVLQRLQSKGLTPSGPAERRVLIRRLSFDLVGLPASPEAIEAFAADDSPFAYEMLVDRLLQSSQYGEKWGRHWLDLVRYAESDGFKQDGYRPQAWRYRDYVVNAFNEDKPYNQFIVEQLAGDELDSKNVDTLAATSYLRHWIYEYNQRDVRTQWNNILNDVTDVTAEVFLGLSVGCARCHDHKFDPILRKDYYRFQAFFAALLPRDDVPLLVGDDLRQYQQNLSDWEQKTADIRQELATIERPIREKVAAGAINKFPPDIRPMLSKSAAEREPLEQQLADLAFRQVVEEYDKLDVAGKLKGEEKEKWQALTAKLTAFEKERPTPATCAFTVTDVGKIAPVTFIPSDRLRRAIAPGFLTVLDPNDATVVPPASGQSTGRRTALANWIASRENPLTARVIVNRVWQYHFGQGIVTTVSDMGHLGESPSHPELLDWLANWFIDNGWSFKKLHRLILTSATYRQTARIESRESPDNRLSVDPENRWLWRMPVRRLDAEEIRDAALAVSGELVLEGGGPSVEGTRPRRTVYTKVIRNVRDPLLDVFDAPDNFNSTAVRNVTTTPTQALVMINGPWMIERARKFAARLEQENHLESAAIAERAIGLAFGRAPTEPERIAAVAFMSKTPSEANRQAPTATRFVTFPVRGGTSLDVAPQSGIAAVMAADSPSLPSDDFTVEAFVVLRSLYDDASVRTIVSQWDSDTKHLGWSLGVTSKRSRYEPRNLVLQLIGSTKEGLAYEVIPSNLRLELNTPYYVAASIRIADTSEKGITFYVKDLAHENSPLQSVSMPHKVIKDYRAKHTLVIGGRHGNLRHQWDGLIDDVRLSTRPLSKEELLVAGAMKDEGLAAQWRFEAEGGYLHDSSMNLNHLTEQAVVSSPETARLTAIVDFCHVLLNSNEFLYTD